MENENNLVKVETEDGKTLNLLILEEFDYKDKKYAVLTELNECNCEEDCECTCGEDCDCPNDCGCKEGKECTCGDDCNCGCSSDESIFILEITKDKSGNEIFKSIEDDKLFDELVDKVDELFSE